MTDGRGDRRVGAWLLVAVLLVAGCGGRLPERGGIEDLPDGLSGETTDTDDPGATTEPGASIEPIDLDLEGLRPQSAAFAGATFTVLSASLTNTHPYPMFADPPAGETFYGVLELEVENPTTQTIDYGFGDEAFALLTWGGAELPVVHSPGVLSFSRLEPGQVERDEVAFGLPNRDALDGAALLIGRAPDTRAVVRLTADTAPSTYPASLAPVDPAPVQAGTIAWTVLSGTASLDAPAGVCCPETGARADDGEYFLVLALRGTVTGSPYGQATVSTELVRLLIDGVEHEPLDFDGQANVPEGQAYEFAAAWVVSPEEAEVSLQFDAGAAGAETVLLQRTATGTP